MNALCSASNTILSVAVAYPVALIVALYVSYGILGNVQPPLVPVVLVVSPMTTVAPCIGFSPSLIVKLIVSTIVKLIVLVASDPLIVTLEEPSAYPVLVTLMS